MENIFIEQFAKLRRKSSGEVEGGDELCWDSSKAVGSRQLPKPTYASQWHHDSISGWEMMSSIFFPFPCSLPLYFPTQGSLGAAFGRVPGCVAALPWLGVLDPAWAAEGTCSWASSWALLIEEEVPECVPCRTWRVWGGFQVMCWAKGRDVIYYLLVLNPEANLGGLELRNGTNNGHWKEELSIPVQNRATEDMCSSWKGWRLSCWSSLYNVTVDCWRYRILID